MRKTWLAALIGVIVLLALCGVASAEKLVIPADVKIIDVEAFYGDTSLDEVVLPDGVVEIGERAFAESGLTMINLPESLVKIADDAFDPDVMLAVEKGTWVYDWAVEKGYQLKPEESPASDFSYRIISEELKTCAITGYRGEDTEIVTPAYNPNGYRVVTIADSAFKDKKIVSIYISNGIESIESGAFEGCKKLDKAVFPNSVKNIGHRLFEYCYSLKDVRLSRNLTSLGKWTFHQCSSLKEIEIPDSVTMIDEWAFFQCKALEEIDIPDSVNTIVGGTFGYCDNLVRVGLPKHLTTIPQHIFRDCGKLRQVNIPEGITAIGEMAFYNCENLTINSLPDSLKIIGAKAFYNCNALTDILIPNSVEMIGVSAFAYCDSLVMIDLPAELKSIETSLFDGSASLAYVEIPDGVTSIGDNAFRKCKSLTSINIPVGVTHIGAGAFRYCELLTSVILPDGLLSIGDSGFRDCVKLEQINIPGSLVELGVYVFNNCGNLIIYAEDNSDAARLLGKGGYSYRIPGITDYSLRYVFSGDDIVGKEITSVDKEIKELSIPDDVTIIGDYTFQDCSNLTRITIPESVTTIGDYAFANCSALTVVEIPNTVINPIGTEAFSGCASSLLIKCDPKDPTGNSESEALRYAKENEIDYFTRVGGIRRALIIGQGNYPPAPNGDDQAATKKAQNSVTAVEKVLNYFGYNDIRIEKDRSAADILNDIYHAAQDLKETDILLFYYIGHGVEGNMPGSITGIDTDANGYLKTVTHDAITAALASTDARKIVVLQSCYSGYAMEAMMCLLADAGDTYIITAANHNKCDGVNENYPPIPEPYWFFTTGFCLGLGWDCSINLQTQFYADGYGSGVEDGAISIEEAFSCARNETDAICNALNNNNPQNVMYSPSGCEWFKPFRLENVR